jgi:hypothetical protein
MPGERPSASDGGGWAEHEQHAEELIDRFNMRVAETVTWAAARAREEAEDLLAEARELRRSGPPQS